MKGFPKKELTHRPQFLYVMGTPKEHAPILGNPHVDNGLEEARARRSYGVEGV